MGEAMAKGFETIPVLDVSGLASGRAGERRRAAERIGAAAREVGFFYASGHDVAPELSRNLLVAAKALFDRPLAEKLAWHIRRSSNHSGYVPEGEEVFEGGQIDRKEAYDVGLDLPGGHGRAPMLGANLWPDAPGFRAAVEPYYAAVAGLARRMFGGFALALGLPEDHFEPHLTAPPSQLRLIHYPFDGEAGDGQGIGAHTDYEFFTILQGTAPGLEVMNGQGRWIDVPPRPGRFVVNIGDMLEAWTNGEFVATSHRVRKVAEERYAFPFFATCDYWTVVEPAARFVTPARPAAYPRLVSGEHLFAQTARTFRYLRARRIALGEGLGFGQAARQEKGRAG